MSKVGKKIAVAVSGSGRSLENLLHAEKEWGFTVAAVISSNISCRGFEIARSHGLPQLVANFSTLHQNGESADYIFAWLSAHDINLVALAGFLKPFPLNPNWHGRVINIHPALLPKFGGKGMYGMRVHQAVAAAGESTTGATVHFVSDEYDTGAIIAQAKVEIEPDDSPQSIADKVFATECALYPAVVADLIDGKLPLLSGKVHQYSFNSRFP